MTCSYRDKNPSNKCIAISYVYKLIYVFVYMCAYRFVCISVPEIMSCVYIACARFSADAHRFRGPRAGAIYPSRCVLSASTTISDQPTTTPTQPCVLLCLRRNRNERRRHNILVQTNGHLFSARVFFVSSKVFSPLSSLLPPSSEVARRGVLNSVLLVVTH